MKIGLFSDTYFPQVSGVATSMKTLKEALEAQGHEVYIFTTTDPNAKGFEKNVIRLPSVPFVSFKDRRLIVRGMLYAYLVAKELELDIIHTQTEFGAGMLGKMVAHQLKIPCIHTYHTMYEDYLHYIAKGRLIKPIHVKLYLKAFSRHVSGIVCPSMRVVESLQKYGLKTPMRVIPTGIDLKKFENPEMKTPEKIAAVKQKLGLKEGELVLLSLSRLSFEKNIQFVINGLPDILAKIPNARLVVAGQGPYADDLKALVKQNNLDDAVIFTGEINNDEVPTYYSMADYFVSCSTSESQGLTYTESMASGTQCVVCGNDYIDSLFDDPSLGKTFRDPADFAQTFLDYYDAHLPVVESITEARLYSMSAEKFATDVLASYDDADAYYKEELQKSARTGTESHLPKRPKILRRRVRQENATVDHFFGGGGFDIENEDSFDDDSFDVDDFFAPDDEDIAEYNASLEAEKKESAVENLVAEKKATPDQNVATVEKENKSDGAQMDEGLTDDKK